MCLSLASCRASLRRLLFEVSLPTAWNGRLYMMGNGGTGALWVTGDSGHAVQWQDSGLVFTSPIGTPLDSRNVTREF
jgi:hypothetical protein